MKRTLSLALFSLLVTWTFGAVAQQPPRTALKVTPKTFAPVQQTAQRFQPLNFREAAIHEAANPPRQLEDIEDIDAPQPPPPTGRHGVAIAPQAMKLKPAPLSTPSFGTGISPGPMKTFKGEFLSATSIPPDTMGAVGDQFVVTVSNDRMRILTRNGIELSRLTLTSFWAGVTIKGATVSAFDPKVYFDRFNNRFILHSSANGQNVNSGACFAVSATNDPTGVWYRYSVVADPASTAAGGHWIDYPSIGHNKNWIVINENVFNFGTAGTGFWGEQIYVLDKQAAYSNTLGTINLFQGDFNATCLTSATPETELACGFTMAPAITEDNTTDTVYMAEDWDSTAAQLRLSKVTGTPGAPVLTVGTQFPQSSEAWRFNAVRIGTANNCGGTCSGGYMPQRQQSANLTSGTRIMANDSRVQNSVLRNGTLYCVQTVMLAATSQPAGTTIGGAGNPVDNHAGIQWWAIDPTNETGGSVAPIQRARIHDPNANNCHNGSGGTTAVAPCNGTTANQFGEFFAFPNISVNSNNDVFIGFTRFSPLTYPNSGYVIRLASDAPNTTRDPVIFRPGQSNYNIGAGSGTSRQNRWGDYSSAQTDPLNDTDFWTVQEYAGKNRNDFLAPSYAGPWETWWAQIRPSGPPPTAAAQLLISQFRLRGPQGVRDEFVELYNPSATPLIIASTDGSDGWALAYSSNGTTVTGVAVVPNGTVIAPHGHFLISDNPDNTAGGTNALTYSLNATPSIAARTADGDTGWALDLADNGGLAIFTTSATANFAAGTRVDSVGFSTIAAGLFKEGNGIPAVTAATPTGQMTFQRLMLAGSPVDTGANENDFQFLNSVVGETLGSTPKLGAAGPANLDSPRHDVTNTAFTSALLDPGVGAGSPANLLRSATVVTNGAFGTITFRRRFTNSTGIDLSKLRFRIVNISTNPPAGAAADLRALSSTTGPVTLSDASVVSVVGTTLETPPTQSAGGGFNGTLDTNSVALATPFTGGTAQNIQFTLGVQTKGAYNFCLAPEAYPGPVDSLFCFSGTTENTPPTILGGSANINAGAPAATQTIATVSDGQDSAGSLTVTALSIPTGITLSNIQNTAGTVTATVSADCSLATNAYNVSLQVRDSENATSNGTFTVNVTATPVPPTPTISGDTNGTGTQDQACPEQPLTLHANGATGATSYTWYSDNAVIPNETSSTLVMTGVGNISVTATNGTCTTPHSATYVVQNPTPHSPFISFRNQPSSTTTLAICQGTSQIIDSDSATGIQWYKDGVAIPGAGSQSYTATQAGVYTAQLNALGCHSQFGRNVTIVVNTPPSAPTATPGGPTTFCAGGSVTLTSSAASGNQWYLNGNPIGGATGVTYNVTASGSYTVKTTDANNCTSPASNAVAVTVNPIPATPTIQAGGPTTFCPGGSVTLTSSAASGNQWFLNGNPIGGATNTTYIATAAGSYTVTATTSGCTSAQSAATTVTISAVPNATITAPATVASGSTGNVASVANAGAGATYNWGITNGTITGGTGTSSITFTAGSAGTLTLQVTVTNAASCSDTKSANVNVVPLMINSVVPPNGPYFGGQPVTINGAGFQAGATVTFGGNAATNVVVVNSTKITAKTPAHAGGTVNVVVTNTNATSATAVNAYTYRPRQFDPNGDNTVDPSDIFYLINYLFTHGPQPAGAAGMMSGDANGDGAVDPADIFYAVAYLFSNGQQPYSAPIDTEAVRQDFGGSITLGQPVERDGRWFVPVIVTMKPGSSAPQALSLNLTINGHADDVKVHRLAGGKAAFENATRTDNGVAYLVSFDDASAPALGANRSIVIAEVELEAPRGADVNVDPSLTMLVDHGFEREATVANGSLHVQGIDVPSPAPQPRSKN